MVKLPVGSCLDDDSESGDVEYRSCDCKYRIQCNDWFYGTKGGTVLGSASVAHSSCTQ